MYAIQIGEIDVIMNAKGAMSSGASLEGRVVSILFPGKQGEEKFLPTCVHCHVAKSTLIINAVGLDGRITLMFDDDDAGAKCTEDALTRLSRQVFVKVSKF